MRGTPQGNLIAALLASLGDAYYNIDPAHFAEVSTNE
jgi:hypothetical protein